MGARSTIDVTREEAIRMLQSHIDNPEDKTDEELGEILSELTSHTLDNYRVVANG